MRRPAFLPEGKEMSEIDAVLARADANLSSSLETLFDLVRIKSISTDPAYRDDCRAAAAFLVRYLSGIGFDASVRETAGNPVVVAHHDGAGPDCPHVLFYGHYDVQPVDPLELWTHDPFAPAIRELAGTAARSSPVVVRRTTRASC